MILIIVFIYGLNFSFKKLLYDYLRDKAPTFFPVEPFFHVLSMECLSKCPDSKKPYLP